MVWCRQSNRCRTGRSPGLLPSARAASRSCPGREGTRSAHEAEVAVNRLSNEVAPGRRRRRDQRHGEPERAPGAPGWKKRPGALVRRRRVSAHGVPPSHQPATISASGFSRPSVTIHAQLAASKSASAPAVAAAMRASSSAGSRASPPRSSATVLTGGRPRRPNRETTRSHDRALPDRSSQVWCAGTSPDPRRQAAGPSRTACGRRRGRRRYRAAEH